MTRALTDIRRIVVKVGSSVLTGGGITLDMPIVEQLCGELAALSKLGREVCLVTSGAIALGRGRLGLRERPRTIPMKQAAAAVGQAILMRRYEEMLAPHGIAPAQILLTHADLADRRRFLNARHALLALWELKALPVINENDSVSIEEIQVGDNDRLSAQVASLCNADLLILLTDIDGLFDQDPRADPSAKRIAECDDLAFAERAAGGAGTQIGTGGMATKIAAARIAGAAGVPTIVAQGREPHVLERLLAGDDLGTRFVADKKKKSARKHWIAHTLRPIGAIVIDAGAALAIGQGGRSLLPAGIVEVRGAFDIGDAVSVIGPDGIERARGIVQYTHDQLRRIAGKRGAQIAEILGDSLGDEAIHRDDLVLL